MFKDRCVLGSTKMITARPVKFGPINGLKKTACRYTTDRPVAALRAAPRRMFIFDASSLAPLGSRRPSAGASRPRMFGSQEDTFCLVLYENRGRTRARP